MKIKNYYPFRNNLNCYGIFSPSIDRFLIVDNLDPWIVFETAKIISSKIIVVCYVLNDKSIENLTNENCLLFGTTHKKGENTYGASLMTSVKQPACMTNLNSEIIEKGWPFEFAEESRRDVVLKIQNYALFVLKCVYAITIADSYRNMFPESKYLHDYLENYSPKEMQIHHDSTTAPNGMVHIIKSILYNSDNANEALEEIRLAWEKYSKNDISGFREKFYQCLEIPVPEIGVNHKDLAKNVTLWMV